jgi:hypothetical protein
VRLLIIEVDGGVTPNKNAKQLVGKPEPILLVAGNIYVQLTTLSNHRRLEKKIDNDIKQKSPPDLFTGGIFISTFNI